MTSMWQCHSYTSYGPKSKAAAAVTSHPPLSRITVHRVSLCAHANVELPNFNQCLLSVWMRELDYLRKLGDIVPVTRSHVMLSRPAGKCRWMKLSLPPQVGLSLGSKLESLSLPGSSITETSLLALLPCLTSLRRLDLRGLDSLFMSGAFLSREEHRQQVVFIMQQWQIWRAGPSRQQTSPTRSHLTSILTIK